MKSFFLPGLNLDFVVFESWIALSVPSLEIFICHCLIPQTVFFPLGEPTHHLKACPILFFLMTALSEVPLVTANQNPKVLNQQSTS